jgi:FtsP/CotA-like multicopper oxidase with cupredoxin domain
VPRSVIGINGRFPGPTIEANLGDTIELNVTNVNIVNGTSIHFHGMHEIVNVKMYVSN